MRMEQWDFSKRSRFGFFAKKDKVMFSEKVFKFSKTAVGNKFAVQCEGISKVSQNVQISGFRNIREYSGFSRKTEVF